MVFNQAGWQWQPFLKLLSVITQGWPHITLLFSYRSQYHSLGCSAFVNSLNGCVLLLSVENALIRPLLLPSCPPFLFLLTQLSFLINATIQQCLSLPNSFAQVSFPMHSWGCFYVLCLFVCLILLQFSNNNEEKKIRPCQHLKPATFIWVLLTHPKYTLHPSPVIQ